MTTVFQFTRQFNGPRGWRNKYHTIWLCDNTMTRAVGIPKDCLNIYVVFSKTHRDNDFTIVKRTPMYAQYGLDVNYHLCYGARDLLARMSRAGYNYVRIEYDE